MKLNISTDKKALLSNFFSLSALQGLQMLLPLITLPYLVRVIGVENFGLVNFALSIVMYFNILVSFGFNFSATRDVSLYRDNPDKVSEIFSAVMIIKSIMLLFSIIILTLLVFSIDRLHTDNSLYYVTFGFVIGTMLFPTWLFQGMEEMKYITYITVASNTLFTVLIFVVIQSKDDYIYVPLLKSLDALLSGSIALWMVFKLFPITFKIPSKKVVLLQLKDSYQFFLSSLATLGSRYYVTTIVGVYFGNTVVGYYTMVEKLFYAFMSIGGIVSRTIYPYMSRTKNLAFFKKIFLIVCGASVLILIPSIVFHDALLKFVFNTQNEMLSDIYVLSFSSAIFGIMSALLSYPLLAAFGHIKYANNSSIYASAVYAVCITISVLVFKNIYLVALSLLAYQVAGVLFAVYYMKKTEIRLFQATNKNDQ